MSITRRDLLGGAAVAAGAVAVADPHSALAVQSPMPSRVLGRTGERVPLVGLGTAPLGSDNTHPDEVTRIVNAILDMGVRYVDTAPVYGDPKSKYGNAEMKLKPVLKARRGGLFVVTKVNAQSDESKDGVLRQLEKSLVDLGVDHVDLVHIHNLGDFNMDKILAKGGALEGLRAARDKGLTRFIGVSGHMRAGRYAKVIESGVIDVTMVALNYADRVHYDFEGLVLPAAAKQKAGVVAMKVLGGAKDWKYDGTTQGTLVDHHEHAIRYALGIPGVHCAVIGFNNEKEARLAIDVARSYSPLSVAEKEALLAVGKKVAETRALYYGHVDG